MKKILSVLIAAAMLVSTLAVCVLPAVALAADSDGEFAATNGQFVISTQRSDEFVEDDNDRLSRPGGVYTPDGFSVNPVADEYSDYRVEWENNSPYFTVQTLQNLKEGFFIEIRIDDFSFWTTKTNDDGETEYTSGDHWFAFTVWDSVGVMPGQLGTRVTGENYGNGIEAQMRLASFANKNEDPKANPEWGLLPSGIQWYDDTETVTGKENTRFQVGSTSALVPGTAADIRDGKLYLTFEIKFDSTSQTWTPYMNGVKAPVVGSGSNAKDYITDALTGLLYGDNESSEEEGLNQYNAYVGFTMYSAVTNAPASFTVTKIGNSKETASVPVGEDNIDGAQRGVTFADIDVRDPERDDPSEPAFVFTGDIDSYKSIRDLSGFSVLENTLDNTIKSTVTSERGLSRPVIRPFDDQSFDARDYPCIALIVKNFCTCTWVDTNHDNVPDPSCAHGEKIFAPYVAGEYYNIFGEDPTEGVKIVTLQRTDDEGNMYSVYVFDQTELMEKHGFMASEQRIHGIYLEFQGVKYADPTRNSFEILAVSRLASEDGAVDWAEMFLDEIVAAPEGGDTTDAPEGGDTTEAPDGGDTTEAPEGGETTEAPATTDAVDPEDTEDPTGGQTTEAPDAPQLPDADSELSIEQAIAIGSAMEHNTYTEGKYIITGTVFEVYNAEYGNMKLVDEKGNILTVYGTWSEDGQTRYDALDVKPVAGDTVTIYGVIGQYNGTAQIKNGWIIFHEPAQSETDEKAPETTEKPNGGETTEKPNTPATTEKPNDKNDEPIKSGCGSVAGLGALTIVAVAAVGLVSFKKKED